MLGPKQSLDVILLHFGVCQICNVICEVGPQSLMPPSQRVISLHDNTEALNGVKSYVSERKQMVSDIKTSQVLDIDWEVPQNSVLSPIWFLFYIQN